MVSRVLLLALGLYIPFIDSADCLLRVGRRWKIKGGRKHVWPTSVMDIPQEVSSGGTGGSSVKPYKVLVSVYNVADTFDEFKDNMSRFGYENVLVIDDASTDKTPEFLRKEGIPFISNGVNLHKPTSILRGLKALPEEIETVAVIDPDSTILNLNPREHNKDMPDFKETLADFQSSKCEACAVRVVARCNSLLEYLQNFEYKISTGLAKKSLQDFCAVSGAFAFFKRDYLQRILEGHSESIYGEDYETSLRILAGGGRIYYDGRLTVMTKQRNTLWSLSQQRMGWDLSLIKIHYFFFSGLKKIPKKLFSVYQYIIYNTIFLILFHPIRVLSILFLLFAFLNLIDNTTRLNMIPNYFFNNPVFFLSYYLFHLVLIYALLLIVERRRRDRYITILPIFPFYVLYINLVPRTLGFLNFFSMLFFKKKIIEDGYK